MSKLVDYINELEDVIALSPATENDIKNIEQELSLTLADDYKDYISTFGAILTDDIELTGFSKSKNRNVVDVTVREHQYNKSVSSNLYVIENLAVDGIIIWQDENGIIYESSPNNKEKKIANSLYDYIVSKN